MRRLSTLERFRRVLCLAAWGIAHVAQAGNTLEVAQTVDSACDLHGGGIAIGVSPDGQHVYEIQQAGDAYVSTRNPVTGALTLVQTLTTAVTPALASVFDVAFSPDGEHVYLASHNSGVVVFDRNVGTGTISVV